MECLTDDGFERLQRQSAQHLTGLWSVSGRDLRVSTVSAHSGAPGLPRSDTRMTGRSALGRYIRDRSTLRIIWMAADSPPTMHSRSSKSFYIHFGTVRAADYGAGPDDPGPQLPARGVGDHLACGGRRQRRTGSAAPDCERRSRHSRESLLPRSVSEGRVHAWSTCTRTSTAQVPSQVRADREHEFRSVHCR